MWKNITNLNNKIEIKLRNLSPNYFLIIIGLLFFMGIGYAAVNASISITGTASALAYGNLFIENASLDDSNSVTETTIPVFNGMALNSTNTFEDNTYAYATYTIKLGNGSSHVKKYTGEAFNVPAATSNIISYTIDGDLKAGDAFLPGQEATMTVTYQYKNNVSTPGTYALEMDFLFDDLGTFFIKNNTEIIDLTGTNTLAPLDLLVVNSGDADVNYGLVLGDNRFQITDENGTQISGLTSKKGTSEPKTVYVKKVDGTINYKTTYPTTLIATGTNNIPLGDLTIKSDITPGYEDTTAPQIGAISLDINNTIGTFDVTWTRTDDAGSDVLGYHVALYDGNNTLIEEVDVTDGTTMHRFEGKDPATYYVVIYGSDDAGNTGKNSCSSASTSTTDCRKSPNTEIRWIKNVTFSVTYMSYTGNSTVNLGETYTCTLSANSNYTLPSSITVTMDGTTLSSGTDYTYSSSNGSVSIPNVTGDINIHATGTSSGICLVEGTDVTLASGSKKKIENINYDDLLKVWNPEKGIFTKEYPIWIENKGTTDKYQETTFSDGTILKTTGYHGIFNADLNRYVSVDNPEEFKIGTSVLKEQNGTFKKVKVIDTHIVNKKVNYYHVVSTTYYNILANNLLTTDGTVILSNLFGFNNDYTWTLKNNQIKYNYQELKHIMPYYMFYGLKAENALYLVHNNYLTSDALLDYFKNNQLKQKILKSPIKISGKNMWMVTTSDDAVNDLNKSFYYHGEGSYYIVPKPKNKKNFKGWYNTVDNKIYYPGDKVQIWTGTHFEIIH